MLSTSVVSVRSDAEYAEFEKLVASRATLKLPAEARERLTESR